MTSGARVPKCPWCGGPVMTREGKKEVGWRCHSCGTPYELSYMMEWIPVKDPEEE